MVFDSLPKESQEEALRIVSGLQVESEKGASSEYLENLHRLLDDRLAAYQKNPNQGRPSAEVEKELLDRLGR